MINGIPQYPSREHCTFVSFYRLGDLTCKLQSTLPKHRFCVALFFYEINFLTWCFRYTYWKSSDFAREMIFRICIEIGNENLCGKITWCVWEKKIANATPRLVQRSAASTYLRKYDIGLILDITELSTSSPASAVVMWSRRTLFNTDYNQPVVLTI